MPSSSRFRPNGTSTPAGGARTNAVLELGTLQRCKQRAQLLEQVEAGAVDHIVVMGAEDLAGGFVVDAHPVLAGYSRDLQDAASDEANRSS